MSALQTLPNVAHLVRKSVPETSRVSHSNASSLVDVLVLGDISWNQASICEFVIQSPALPFTMGTIKKDLTSKATKKKAWGTKQVLASPFAPTFPSPDPDTRGAVLEILLGFFPAPFAQRVAKPRTERLRSTDRNGDANSAVAAVSEKQPQSEKEVMKCKKPPGLLCGINEVTKALEKDLVDVCVVSRDVVPSIMISHLPVLCYMKSAKLIVMPGNGAEMGEIFGTRRLLAFAITRGAKQATGEDIGMKSLAEKLAPLATKLDYPWLAAANGAPIPPLPDPMVVPHRSKKDIG